MLHLLEIQFTALPLITAMPPLATLELAERYLAAICTILGYMGPMRRLMRDTVIRYRRFRGRRGL
jgi:hypothetical protein